MATLASDLNCLGLPPSLTLRGITALQGDIIRHIDSAGSPVLEITDDAQVDLSFIQLIESARLYAAAAGKTLLLSRPATADLRDLLERSGFIEGMDNQDLHFWLHQGKNQ